MSYLGVGRAYLFLQLPFSLANLSPSSNAELMV